MSRCGRHLQRATIIAGRTVPSASACLNGSALQPPPDDHVVANGAAPRPPEVPTEIKSWRGRMFIQERKAQHISSFAMFNNVSRVSVNFNV